MTCNECIHNAVCYRVDSVQSDYARKCGDFVSDWIPVSERLPENSGRYLAYIISRHDDKLRYIMTCDYFADSYWNWFPDDECASDNVIAWMPLPTPYDPRERSEE